MSLTAEAAYAVLELSVGADSDTVRTSYKRLAMKCHPAERNNNTSANKVRFCQYSQAYKRLAYDEDDNDDVGRPVLLHEALKIYSSVFKLMPVGNYNGCSFSNSDTSDEDDVEDDHNYVYESLNKTKFFTMKGLSSPKRLNQRVILTEEERNRNARELISDEEREKRDKQEYQSLNTNEDLSKSSKKRLKKRKQREKKRLEKQDQDQDDEPPTNNEEPTVTENVSKPKSQSRKDKKKSATEEELDPTAAFVSTAINKKKKPVIDPTATTKKDKTDAKTNGHVEDEAELDAIVLRSRRVAIRGNEMAQSGHYAQAIELFSEAIKLDPTDFRFFGNRSYCFDRKNNFEKALKDAEKAISLSIDWPKGYFRKGRALAGLLKFAEAEQAFLHVLKLDKNCDDALQELQRVRVQQLIDMGFSQTKAELGIRQYETVRNALDSLLSGQDNTVTSDGSLSEDDNQSVAASPSTTNNRSFQPAQASERLASTESIKIDPSNPNGYRTLWVGNVLPDVTEKKLYSIFNKFGNILSVRCLPEKFCAFINYGTKESAGKAMTTMQGGMCSGQRLLIKFPDHPIENGIVLRGGSTPRPPVKQSGPVNDGECYFWRTTGCQFGDKCHYVHDPAHKGIDRKPWQRS